MPALLACIDASAYATSVCDHAAWAALRLGASVELLHVVQRKDAIAARNDLSGAVGLGAKSSLMEEITRIEESEAKLAREQGQALLRAGEERLRAAGVGDVRLCHRHGGIVETVIEREADADLVVLGKRGASADFARGHLGSKVERVVRASIRPVLVASRAFKPIERAVIAYDGGPSSEKAVRFAAESPLFADISVHLVMAGGEKGKLGRAAEPFGGRATASFRSGSAEAAIGAEMAERGGDLLVMGAYGHSPLRRLIVGSTTTAMTRTCRAPVLLFR